MALDPHSPSPRPTPGPKSGIADRLRPGKIWLPLLLSLLVLAGCVPAQAGEQPQVSLDLPPGAQVLGASTPAAADPLLPAPGASSVEGEGASPPVLPAGQDGAPLSGPALGARLEAPQVNTPTRIEIPAIQVDAPVIPVGWRAVQLADGQIVSVWEVADYAVGWHKNSALPGQGDNVVLSGHNNIKGAVFRKLYTLEAGDEITVWVGNQAYRYRVDQVMILPERDASLEQRRANARWIRSFGEERLTLVSCWPEDDNTHRVVVVAFPAP